MISIVYSHYFLLDLIFFSIFRRGLKAAFMLVPLFGLQMLLTIYRPGDHMAGAHVYECITHIINNSQVTYKPTFTYS